MFFIEMARTEGSTKLIRLWLGTVVWLAYLSWQLQDSGSITTTCKYAHKPKKTFLVNKLSIIIKQDNVFKISSEVAVFL